MSSTPEDAALVEQLRRDLSSLQIEVAALHRTVSSLQDRLSNLEGRTLPDEFEILPSEPAPVSAYIEAGYSVGSERQGIARDIGTWIRRALQGQRRGLSGRERISQGSRYYLVFRDFESQLHDPPLLFHSWSDCKSLVTPRNQLGDSLYIGLPTREESRIVCTSAGLNVPSGLTDGRSGRPQ